MGLGPFSHEVGLKAQRVITTAKQKKNKERKEK
jgi:hypothetical protein